MIDSITDGPRPLQQKPPRYLVPNPATFTNYSCCPWAKSVIVKDIETNAPVLRPVTCKRWGCAYCAPRKIKKLAFLTNGAMPNRWIRLGVNPSLYSSPEEAWRHTSPLVPELCRKIRKNRGECEYLRVAEIHNGTTRYKELQEPGKALGFPHYHAMLRSVFIPQKELSNMWAELASAPHVYIAKIDQTFSSFRYMTKYLTKLHRIEWTDRHVSYSKNFFRPEDMEKLAWPEREVIDRSETHPWKYLSDNFPEDEVALNEDGSYTLPYKPLYPERDVSMEELGLRDAAPPEPEPVIAQQYLQGLEDVDRPFGD
jgi:hypothetical protein